MAIASTVRVLDPGEEQVSQTQFWPAGGTSSGSDARAAAPS